MKALVTASALFLAACGSATGALTTTQALSTDATATSASTGPLLVFSSVSLKPTSSSVFEQALPTVVSATRSEEGNIRYYPLKNTNVAGNYNFIEAWQSQDALTSHFASPAVASFLANTQATFASAPVIETYAPFGDLDWRLGSALLAQGVIATVKLTVKDQESATKFLTVANQLDLLSRTEPGNRAAEFWQSTTNPLTFRGVIIFADAQTFAGHSHGQAEALFAQQGMPLLATSPEFDVYTSLP